MAGEEAQIESIDGSPNEVENDSGGMTPNTRATRFVQRWMGRVKRSKSERSRFYTRAKQAISRYTADEYNEDYGYNMHYPLFWSNVQVLRGAMFTAAPVPDCRRRFDQGDPNQAEMQNMLSTALERAIEFNLDTSDFNGHLNMSLTDYLVPGLGQTRISYEARVEEEPVIDPKTGLPLGDINEAGEIVAQQMPVIKDQKIIVEHVKWDDFAWDYCLAWEDCGWVAFRHWLTRKEVLAQFDVDLKSNQISETVRKQGKKLFAVWEIWDKDTKRVIFIAEGHLVPLRVTKDPLGLRDFFPCPKPMMANISPNRLEPIPDFFFYEKQEIQVDRITRRINNLTATSTVLRGFYDASLQEDLNQLSECDDGEFIPVNGLAQKLQQSGQGGGDLWNKTIANWPIEQSAKVIQILQSQRESELNHVYQITGISDIMRGYSKASETLGAQEIKQSAVSNRLATRRNVFDHHCRDIFRIMADLAAKHFTPETWYFMTGIQVTPQMEEVLRNDVLVEYAVDIETDSTVHQDTDREKQLSIEAVKVTSETLSNLMPLMGQGLPGDAVVQMILTAMRPFKYSKNFEAAVMQLPSTQQQFGQIQQQMQQLAEQNQQLTAQLQQAMERIAAFDMRDQARKDTQIEAEARRDDAQSTKLVEEAKTEETERVLNLAKARSEMQPKPAAGGD
jgi:hypothetical protein